MSYADYKKTKKNEADQQSASSTLSGYTQYKNQKGTSSALTSTTKMTPQQAMNPTGDLVEDAYLTNGVLSPKMIQGNNLDVVGDAIKKSYQNNLAKTNAVQAENQTRLNALNMLKNNEDYAEKSAYVPKDTYRNTDNLRYNYINNDEEAKRIQKENTVGKAEEYGQYMDNISKDNNLQYMDNDQRGLYNYIYATEGKDKAEEYISLIGSDLNKKMTEATQKEATEYANQYPVTASIESVVKSPLNAVASVGQVIDYAKDNTIDQNAWYNQATIRNSTIREAVSNNLSKDTTVTELDPTAEQIFLENGMIAPKKVSAGEVKSFLYQTGMSIADNLFNIVATGGSSLGKIGEVGTLLLMSSGAAANSVIQAKNEGLSDTRALTTGIVAGVIEYLTEKMGYDELMNKILRKENITQYLGRNIFAEAFEEGTSDILNYVFEAMYDELTDEQNSQIKRDIRSLMATGMSEAEASAQVWAEWTKQLKLDMLGGAISGGVLGGGGIVGSIAGRNIVGRINNIQAINEVGQSNELSQKVVNAGLNADPNSEAYKLATQNTNYLKGGDNGLGFISTYQQAKANQQASIKENQSFRDTVNSVVNEAKANKSVTNKMAETIMANPRLMEAMGIDTNQNDNKVREEVKKVIEELAFDNKANLEDSLKELASQYEEIKQPSQPISQRAVESSQTADLKAQVDDKQKQLLEGQMKVAEGLGEEGKALYQNIANNDKSFESFGNFLTYYNAGRQQADVNKISLKYTSNLTSEQLQEAFKAGVADAKASADLDTNANLVKGSGKIITENDSRFTKAQLENYKRNATLARVNSPSIYNAVENLARKLGVDVVFTDSVGEGENNGSYREKLGVIEIAYDTTDFMFEVTKHEFTHRLQSTSPRAYNQLKQMILKEFDADQISNEIVRRWAGDYNKSEDEIVAYYTSRMFTEDGYFGRLVSGNKTLGDKLINTLKKVTYDIKKVLGKEFTDAERLEAIQRQWEKALNESDITRGISTNLKGEEKELFEKYSLKRVERTITKNVLKDGEHTEARIYEVSVNLDDLVGKDIKATINNGNPISLEQAEQINTNNERLKDWKEIYSDAEIIDKNIDSLVSKDGSDKKVAGGIFELKSGGKLDNVIIARLTQGCQRSQVTIERVENGVLPNATRVEACYGGDCWANKTLAAKFSNFENMEVRDLKFVSLKRLEKWLQNKANIDRMNRAEFIRHGYAGDDSHLFGNGLALEWLKLCKQYGVKTKQVFISAAYAPVTMEMYKQYKPYADMFEIHFSNSGWFHKNEIMIRLNEFQKAKTVGLHSTIRLVTNNSNISGITFENQHFIEEQMNVLGVKQREVLETPFHDDGITKKNVQKRSDATGKFENICCETGKCQTCRIGCMVRINNNYDTLKNEIRENRTNGEIPTALSYQKGVEDDTRNSIKGEKANLTTNDKKTLKEAKSLDAQGINVEEIYARTGWYKQSDGKWRTNLDLGKWELNPYGLKEVKKETLSKRLAEAEKSFKAGTIDKETYDHLVNFATDWSKEDISSGKLDAFLKAPKLFNAYPQLAKVSVYFEELGDYVGGFTNAAANSIHVNNKFIDNEMNMELKRTLFHEIQHMIQVYEGFAEGADPMEVGMDGYLKAGGEIEARDVEDRIFRTSYYNRNNMPTRFSTKALEQRNNGDMLSESKFYQLYSAHKLDVGERFGDIQNQIDKIKQDGFKSSTSIANVVPSSLMRYPIRFIDGEPQFNNIVQARYAPRKGEYILFVPNNFVTKDDIIKNGFKPFDYEIAQVEYDFQPYYEVYKKAYAENNTRFSTKDSEGNNLSKGQQDFFQDSKIRDENGNLLVVYHGTNENFTVFDRTKTRANMDIQGNFFTPYKLDAQGYGENVGAYYINITNPASESEGYKALNKFKGQNEAGIKARDYLISLGYDGVNNANEEFIAFDSSQIKLTTNTNPSGNEDVRYSIKEGLNEDAITDVANNSNPIRLNENAFQKGNTDLVTMVSKYFDSIGGKVESPELGTVHLTRRGVKNDISHGIGRQKASAFMSIPTLIQNGRVVSYEKSYNGKASPSWVVAAPISSDSGEGYLAAVILEDLNSNKDLYVHELIMVNKNGETPFKTRLTKDTTGGVSPSNIYIVLNRLIDVKNDSKYLELAKDPKKNESKLRTMVDSVAKENGYDYRAYHGTPMAGFNIFNNIRKGIRLVDGEWVNYSENQPIMFTTSRRDADSYGGNPNSNTYVPGEDTSYQTKVATFQDIVNNPNKFTEQDIINAFDRFDSNNAIRESFDEGYSKQDIIDLVMQDLQENGDLAGSYGLLETEFETNSKAGREATYYDNHRTYDAYLRIQNPLVYDGHQTAIENNDFYNKVRELMATDEYDGLIAKGCKCGYYHDNGDIYVVKESNQIKLANLTLKDENGDIIPLSERFNSNNEDIRYSTKDSNGNRLTKNQEEYFKDSQIRDKNGNLLVMYHGTNNGRFNVFNPNNAKESSGYNTFGDGNYFTRFESTAEYYGKTIVKTYLNITNPFEVNINANIVNDIERQFGNVFDGDEYFSKSSQVDSVLKNLGYNGVVVKNDLGDIVVAIAYDSNQIKRVTNSNPTSSEDIRYSVKGESKQDKEIQALRDKLKEQQDKYEKKLQTYKLKANQRYQERVEKLNDRQLREKIAKHSKELSTRLLTPTDKKHIPEELRTTVASLLSVINQESTFDWRDGFENSQRRTEKGKGIATKRTEQFVKLRATYERVLAQDNNLVIDPDLMNLIHKVEEYREIPLGKMSHDQLLLTWNTLKAVEASMYSANRLFKTERAETLQDLADRLFKENANKKERTQWNTKNARGAILNWGERTIEIGMMNPLTALHRLGETGDDIFHALREAQDEHIVMLDEISKDVQKMLEGFDRNTLDEVHKFKGIELTTGQLMSLYELYKRDQARQHILVGGIRAGEVNSEGVKAISKSNPTLVGMEELGKMFNVLTEDQKKLADKIQNYLSTNLAELGNDASMDVYGYRKFTEKNYFPIKTDKNQVHRDSAKETGVTTIASKGIANAVLPYADNAVIVDDILDVLAQHATDMSYYGAWLGISEDLRRILNYRYRGENPGSVRGLIEQVMGKNATEYFNDFLDSINQSSKSPKSYGFDSFIGNYKAAAVAGNIRVIVQQPTAILRALSELDSKYLTNALTMKRNWEEVKEHSPIAIWKDWGNFEIGSGKQLKEIILGTDKPIEKIKEKTMQGASDADSFAWSILWNAVKLEVEDTTSYEVGSEDYWEAVTKRFEDIVDKTQVVDGVLQRSGLMRSKNALDKMSSSFMAEPTKVYNMFANAVYDYKQTKDGKKLGKVVYGVTASFIANAIVQSIIDAMRNDDKDKDYWEKFLAAFIGEYGWDEDKTFTKNMLDNIESAMGSNLLSSFNIVGYIPYLKDAASIIQGYDVTRMDMDAIVDTVNACNYMVKALSGTGKMTISNATLNLLAQSSKLLGLPIANLKRDLVAGISTIASLTGSMVLEYNLMKALYNIKSDSTKTMYYDMLFKAYQTDKEAYRMIYRDMIKNGYKSQNIENSIKSRLKK